MQRRMAGPDWAMLLGLALTFGSAFFFVHVGLRSFGPISVGLGRVGIAACVLTAVALVRGRRYPTTLSAWLALLVMGALNNAIPFSLISWSQLRIDSGLAAIPNATTPIFTVLLAHLAGDEKLTAGRVAGVLLGFLGVAVLIGPAALARFDPTDLAEVAILGAACSYAFAGLWGRRFRALPAEVAASGMLMGSTAILLPIALVFEHPWTVQPRLDSLAAIASLAVIGTAIAYLLYFRLLARVGPTNLLLVTFLLPVVALALGTGFLDEPIRPAELVGLLLIMAGLAAIDGRLAGCLVGKFRATSPGAGATSGLPRDCRRS
jgi:drug/metabolite transporter (DMT)-like permease